MVFVGLLMTILHCVLLLALIWCKLWISKSFGVFWLSVLRTPTSWKNKFLPLGTLECKFSFSDPESSWKILLVKLSVGIGTSLKGHTDCCLLILLFELSLPTEFAVLVGFYFRQRGGKLMLLF